MVLDPTKTELTEGEFIVICIQGLQSQMTIGAIITLDNTYQSTWEVIGKNHDGTTGTVDIMSHTNINEMAFGSNNVYSGSSLQTFCNTTIPNAFTNSITKSLIKTMDVASNGETLTDQKGKALSCTEVGASGEYALANEGTSYGLSNYLYRSQASGTKNNIWTRSSRVSSSIYVVCVGDGGGIGGNNYYDSRGVLPVLRF